jgi:hypothetical protein
MSRVGRSLDIAETRALLKAAKCRRTKSDSAVSPTPDDVMHSINSVTTSTCGWSNVG